MDKKQTNDDKKPLKVFQNGTQHRLVGKMPDFCCKYGLWIINASEQYREFDSGYYWKCPIRQFEFYSISHLIGGSGRLWLQESGEQNLRIGELVIITPGTSNKYGGLELPYIEDSIRFCGPLADMMTAAGIITSGAFMLGTTRVLLPIIRQVNNPARDVQIRANLMLQNLLTELHLKKRESLYKNKVEDLINLIQNDLQHWWTVEELAEQASISTESLRKRFLEYTGMLPKAYIEESKLRGCCELLISSNLSIREVAKRFGYSDPYHFSRRFKIHMGVSPEIYRQQYVYAQ